MTENTLLLTISKALLLGVAAGLLFATAARVPRLLGRQTEVPTWIGSVLISVPIVIVANIAGYLAGAAGSTAVGNLLPAVLALIAGFNVYLFGANAQHRPVSIYALFLFAIFLFYGIIHGLIVYRDGPYSESYLADRELQMQQIAGFEKRIRQYRLNMGLPEEPPGWATNGDGRLR
jgi:hypothetical protein